MQTSSPELRQRVLSAVLGTIAEARNGPHGVNSIARQVGHESADSEEGRTAAWSGVMQGRLAYRSPDGGMIDVPNQLKQHTATAMATPGAAENAATLPVSLWLSGQIAQKRIEPGGRLVLLPPVSKKPPAAPRAEPRAAAQPSAPEPMEAPPSDSEVTGAPAGFLSTLATPAAHESHAAVMASPFASLLTPEMQGSIMKSLRMRDDDGARSLALTILGGRGLDDDEYGHDGAVHRLIDDAFAQARGDDNIAHQLIAAKEAVYVNPDGTEVKAPFHVMQAFRNAVRARKQ